MRALRSSSAFEDNEDTVKFSQKGSIVLGLGFVKVNLVAFWRFTQRDYGSEVKDISEKDATTILVQMAWIGQWEFSQKCIDTVDKYLESK